MFEKLKAVSTKANTAVLAVAIMAVSSLQSAHAALPTGVADFFTSLTADFTELLNTYLYPLMFVITGGIIIMGLVKKGANKVK